MAKTYVGVDLSKDWLDVSHPRSGASKVANTAPAVRAWIGSLRADDHLVFEATSGCDGTLLREANARRHPVSRMNPLQAWHFAQSLNLPKTDRVDACMLARLGAERQLDPDPGLSPERAQLRALNDRRTQLKRMETQEKNRLARCSARAVATDIRASLRSLALRIAKIERAIDACFAKHPELARQRRLLETIPGVGPVVSTTLLSSMPELGTCDRRQIASLGGVAPKARESGRWRGQRRIGDGRRHIRRTLYMAALSSLRHRSFGKGLVTSLRAKNRPGKVILIALARKLLTLANAVIRDRTPFKATI